MGTNKVQKKSKGVKTVEQAGKKSGKGKKYSNVPPPKAVEEESDSEESSEDEVEVPVKKGAKKVVKPQESDDSSSEESSEEEEVAKPAPKAKKAPVKAAKPAPAEESSDEDDSEEDDSSEEEEEEKPKAKAAAKKPAPKKVVAKEESSDDSDEDESEEEMETKPTKAAKAKAAPAKKESSDEEEDSDDEDDSEEEEAMEVKQTKTAVKRKKTEESSEEEDSDDEEDSDEEDAPPAKKVKTPAGAKKPKANGDSTPAPANGSDDMISIFIANVDPSTTGEQIQEFFEENGVTCSNARMVKSRKFAYVDVASEEEFNKAIELSESELNGSNIRLERGRKMDKTPQRGGQSNERAPPRGRSDGSDERTLFAKGLSSSTSKETLIENFGASDARIPMNEEGRPKGFAFIEFASEEAAEEALKNQQGVEIDGWSLMLDYCGSKRKNFASPGGRGGGRGGGGRGGGRGGGFGSFGGGDTSNSKTLFVKGISHDATEDSIASSLGASSVRIPRDRETNEIKGFAYADFEDRSGAQSAIDSYQGNEGMFLDFARERTSSPGGRGGFGGRGGGRGFGGRGGGRGFGGRGGGGFGGRGGGRGRGGFGGGRGRGGFEKKDGIKAFQGKKKTFGDD
eukprot:XP_003727573.1 PREDICTED: nucleolin isoform X2 [Strongylocentrotus purpuratus]